jgi:hypothetical protein
LYKTGPSSYEWRVLGEEHEVDTNANTVSVGITSLNPLNSPGAHGVFANRPGPTIETITHYVAPTILPAKAVLVFEAPAPGDPADMTGGSESIYNHTLEIPNYEVTTVADEDRIAITLSQATLFERLSEGGVSWPDQSNSLFVIRTEDASGDPVAFTDPVNLTVEFFDGTENDLDDVVNLLAFPILPTRMTLAYDALDGGAVTFRSVSGVDIEVTTHPGGGFVRGTGITNLTAASGKGVWGAVGPGPTLTNRGWEEYE